MENLAENTVIRADNPVACSTNKPCEKATNTLKPIDKEASLIKLNAEKEAERHWLRGERC